MPSNEMISDFSGKTLTASYFNQIESYTGSLGAVSVEKKAQASFSVIRKFLWCWAYEKTADGTLFLAFLLDKDVTDPNFHEVSHVSKSRWNHDVVLKSTEATTSSWLRASIRAGHVFAQL